MSVVRSLAAAAAIAAVSGITSQTMAYTDYGPAPDRGFPSGDAFTVLVNPVTRNVSIRLNQAISNVQRVLVEAPGNKTGDNVTDEVFIFDTTGAGVDLFGGTGAESIPNWSSSTAQQPGGGLSDDFGFTYSGGNFSELLQLGDGYVIDFGAIIHPDESDPASPYLGGITAEIQYITPGGQFAQLYGDTSVVPEPASLALVGVGGTLLSSRRRGRA